MPEILVDSRMRQQFLMRRKIRQFAFVQHDRLVRSAHDRQPVRDDQHRPAPRQQRQIFLDTESLQSLKRILT